MPTIRRRWPPHSLPQGPGEKSSVPAGVPTLASPPLPSGEESSVPAVCRETTARRAVADDPSTLASPHSAVRPRRGEQRADGVPTLASPHSAVRPRRGEQRADDCVPSTLASPPLPSGKESSVPTVCRRWPPLVLP